MIAGLRARSCELVEEGRFLRVVFSTGREALVPSIWLWNELQRTQEAVGDKPLLFGPQKGGEHREESS